MFTLRNNYGPNENLSSRSDSMNTVLKNNCCMQITIQSVCCCELWTLKIVCLAPVGLEKPAKKVLNPIDVRRTSGNDMTRVVFND